MKFSSSGITSPQANLRTLTTEPSERLESRSSHHFHSGAKDDIQPSARDYILRLAQRHQIASRRSFQDTWAAAVTRLAGDDVMEDPIKDLLVALKRAGKVSATEMTTLLITYLREKKESSIHLRTLTRKAICVSGMPKKILS